MGSAGRLQSACGEAHAGLLAPYTKMMALAFVAMLADSGDVVDPYLLKITVDTISLRAMKRA